MLLVWPIVPATRQDSVTARILCPPAGESGPSSSSEAEGEDLGGQEAVLSRRQRDDGKASHREERRVAERRL